MPRQSCARDLLEINVFPHWKMELCEDRSLLRKQIDFWQHLPFGKSEVKWLA